MRYITIGKIMVSIGIILWLVETAYFGSNVDAINIYEKWADLITTILVSIGLGFYFIPLIRFYEEVFEKWKKRVILVKG